MTNRIGSDFESTTVRGLRNAGFLAARRIVKHGNKDLGDIEGLPDLHAIWPTAPGDGLLNKVGILLGCKNENSLKVGAGMDQLRVSAANWLEDNQRLGYDHVLAWHVFNRRGSVADRNYWIAEQRTMITLLQMLERAEWRP